MRKETGKKSKRIRLNLVYKDSVGFEDRLSSLENTMTMMKVWVGGLMDRIERLAKTRRTDWKKRK